MFVPRCSYYYKVIFFNVCLYIINNELAEKHQCSGSNSETDRKSALETTVSIKCYKEVFSFWDKGLCNPWLLIHNCPYHPNLIS